MVTITPDQLLSLGSNYRKISKKNLARISQGKLAIRSEDDICIDLVKYLESRPDILFFSHIRSESGTSSKGQLAKFTRMGVKSGLPDYLIIGKKYDGSLVLILLEVKTEDGAIKKEQKFFFSLIEQISKVCPFIQGRICREYEECKSFVTDCLV